MFGKKSELYDLQTDPLEKENVASKHPQLVKKFYDYHEDEELKVTDYSSALQGKYVRLGGLKYLYTLFPEGPIYTVTQLAGISVTNTRNNSMGSVQ